MQNEGHFPDRSDVQSRIGRPGADPGVRIPGGQMHLTEPPHPDLIRREASIRRAVSPSCYRLHRLRRWRWSVTRYRASETRQPGVYDGRVHLFTDSGHTFTRIGAALAASRHLVVRDGR